VALFWENTWFFWENIGLWLSTFSYLCITCTFLLYQGSHLECHILYIHESCPTHLCDMSKNKRTYPLKGYRALSRECRAHLGLFWENAWFFWENTELWLSKNSYLRITCTFHFGECRALLTECRAHLGLFWENTGFFWENIRLCWENVELFWKNLVLFFLKEYSAHLGSVERMWGSSETM